MWFSLSSLWWEFVMQVASCVMFVSQVRHRAKHCRQAATEAGMTQSHVSSLELLILTCTCLYLTVWWHFSIQQPLVILYMFNTCSVYHYLYILFSFLTITSYNDISHRESVQFQHCSAWKCSPGLGRNTQKHLWGTVDYAPILHASAVKHSRDNPEKRLLTIQTTPHTTSSLCVSNVWFLSKPLYCWPMRKYPYILHCVLKMEQQTHNHTVILHHTSRVLL